MKLSDACVGALAGQMSDPADPAGERLAALREDLSLQPASPGVDGTPHWHVHDAVRNRFFRIGWLEFELLSRWRRSPRMCWGCSNSCKRTSCCAPTR